MNIRTSGSWALLAKSCNPFHSDCEIGSCCSNVSGISNGDQQRTHHVLCSALITLKLQ